MTHLARAILLLALAGLIGKLLISGQLALYMSSTLDPLTSATGLLLAGMGIFELRSFLRRTPSAGHGGSPLDEALTYLVVLVPVGLGMCAVPRSLDTSALGGQDPARAVVAYSTSPAVDAASPPAHPIRDVADLFTYLRQAGESGVGQPVHLVGMLAHSQSVAPDEFVLLRYTIVHCVADAQPIGLLVRTPTPTFTADPSGETWIEIDGTLASSDRDGAHLISVAATRMAATDEPPDPYLRSL